MSFREYLADQWRDITILTIQHLEIVLISVGIAAVLGVALGMLVEGHPVARRIALTLTAALLTIPSFALFGLLITFLGLGATPTIVALTMYALFPILRNTVTGLASVPSDVEDAARGMGLSPRRRLLIVRLPLAWPVLLNGIRLATIMCIGIAAIAAAVDGPGLGQLIFDGLARMGGANALNDTVAGLLGLALLALALDLAFLLIARLTTSRGIRD